MPGAGARKVGNFSDNPDCLKGIFENGTCLRIEVGDGIDFMGFGQCIVHG